MKKSRDFVYPQYFGKILMKCFVFVLNGSEKDLMRGIKNIYVNEINTKL